jgi:ribosomal protein S18 acetylase RimI-like enzyme
MTTECVVRRATPREDEERIAILFDSYRQFYDQTSDLRLAREFIHDRLNAGESVILIAESPTREALGFVQLYPCFSSVAARRIWVLNDLFVAPEARGSGVGRALMEGARRLALETGAKRLVLETLTGNRAAQSLYESLGYVCENEAARFYSLELP